MAELASLFLYIVCFLSSAGLLSVGIKRSSRLIKLFAVLIPVLLIGLRVDVGTDYSNYLEMYRHYSGMNLADLLASTSGDSVEVGFFGIIKFASLFTNDAWLMFLLSAAATMGIAYAAIKRLSPNSIPLTFLLYLFVLVPFVMNGVRQGIAVSIIFFAYSYIIKGKPVKYLTTVLCASLFHMSALAIMPLYLLRFITVKNRTDAPFTLLLSVLTAVLTVLLIPLILIIISAIPALSVYARYEGWEVGIAWPYVALMAAFSPLVVVLYRRVTRSSPSMHLMVALFFLEFASLFLGGVSTAFSRMSFYLAVGGLAYMANIPLIFSGNTRRAIQFLVVMYGLLYFTKFYYIAGYSDIFPYKNIWGG